ncbi:MAG TPA: FG-GAP repeat protein, partial [Myxococcota bacterium]|nr:FG-GAP repeat protein [Myxococcota bacterium]
LNGSPIPGNFGRAIAAPDWDGDGLPDIATYNNEEQESDFFVYRGTDADLLAHYYRDPVPPPTAWETPFGFGAQTVDGLVEEGQQAILIEDRDTPNGDRIRVLLPGSCGSEPVAETPYLLRDPLTIEYTPFLAGGDLMVQMLTNNEILLSSNQF